MSLIARRAAWGLDGEAAEEVVVPECVILKVAEVPALVEEEVVEVVEYQGEHGSISSAGKGKGKINNNEEGRLAHSHGTYPDSTFTP